MTISWPGTLPSSPLVNGFQVKQRSNVVYTATAQGYQRARKRFTGKVYDIIVTLPPLTATQLALFETFYNDTTEDGTQEFQWYDFSTNPRSAQAFRFGQQTPDISCLASPGDDTDGLWRVSFTLEMRK